MYGRLATAYVGTIHYIIVQEREVVEYFNRLGKRQGVLLVTSCQPAAGKYKLHP